MMRFLTAFLFALIAAPAMAASTNPLSGDFWALSNTNLIVSLAFILFVIVLVYLKVPGTLGGMLDKRADGIKAELEEAKALREEAQTLLASYERKQKEVQAQADRIVAQAKDEATKAAAQAKDDIKASIARRLAGAQDKIASAEAAAIKEIRNRAVVVAVAAAKDIIAQQMDAKGTNALIDDAIATVGDKLH